MTPSTRRLREIPIPQALALLRYERDAARAEARHYRAALERIAGQTSPASTMLCRLLMLLAGCALLPEPYERRRRGWLAGAVDRARGRWTTWRARWRSA